MIEFNNSFNSTVRTRYAFKMFFINLTTMSKFEWRYSYHDVFWREKCRTDVRVRGFGLDASTESSQPSRVVDPQTIKPRQHHGIIYSINTFMPPINSPWLLESNPGLSTARRTSALVTSQLCADGPSDPRAIVDQSSFNLSIGISTVARWFRIEFRHFIVSPCRRVCRAKFQSVFGGGLRWL